MRVQIRPYFDTEDIPKHTPYYDSLSSPYLYNQLTICDCECWIECFPDIKHLNTAKVYCTITKATKPAYFNMANISQLLNHL